ncbi:hypothetical protein BLA29_013965, partial [Euroglyphus maynei]
MIEKYYGSMTINDFIEKIHLSNCDYIEEFGLKFKKYVIKTKPLKMPKIFPNLRFQFKNPDKEIRWIVLCMDETFLHLKKFVDSFKEKAIEYNFGMEDCSLTQQIKL